jgi:hypothetical protein
MYPNYYAKEKVMIVLAHIFHANHIGNDHPFFFGMVHTKTVQVQDYDLLSENDLIGKIVNILLFSDKPLEYIKGRFPEYFNSHIEHIGLYRNYCRAKKTFDAKFRTRMNAYNSIVSFTPTEPNLLLSGYEERLQKKRENNKQKRRYNADLTLEDTADLIEQKRKEDLEAVVHTIKNNFSNNKICVKKFKRDTSDDVDEDEDDKKNVTVAQKIDQYIEHYSLVSYNPTETVPENFISSDIDFDDCTATDFEPQNLIAPEAPQFDYTTEDVLPDYHPSARVIAKRVINFDDQ